MPQRSTQPLHDPAGSVQAPGLHARLLQLAAAIDREEDGERARIDAALPMHRASAANLAHYIGLRKQDLHRLQLELAGVGLSSLGRCEGHVRDTVRRLCAWLSSGPSEALGCAPGPVDRAAAESLLHRNTRALFGPRPAERHVYIMVTAPDAAQATKAWAEGLVDAGADLLRINGAHESPREWRAVVAAWREAARARGRSARVIVDLPGPKLRTEITQTERTVLRFPRRKSRFGRTLAPTRLLLSDRRGDAGQLQLPAAWIARLRKGDCIQLIDSGGRARRLEVRGPVKGGVLAECGRSLYLTGGLALEWRRRGKLLARGRIGALPRAPRTLWLGIGDELLLNASGRGSRVTPRALAFPEPALLAQLRPGERVLLDDGKLLAVVESAGAAGVLCRVQRALKSPARLRSGKGIAFPDSELSLGRLSAQDEIALAFALEHADAVGVSFVNTPQDVALVSERLRPAGRPDFGMILKLETRAALRNLPAILFEALRHDPVGLMIARGDLAVELSFERLAEVQEELLWFGEACHLPVVWATQVLDSVARTGLPTRAEVTDAAMSMRAECVMLNRGPHVGAAVRMLVDIIRRMEAHQFKKRSLYRPLAMARGGAPGPLPAPGSGG
jgi:pyruvate kinase